MRILVIGGTVFLGRHIVEQAIASGHQVTMFNRGTRSISEFRDVELLKGDREHDLSALQGRMFDAVIDTCGYRPEVVGKAVDALKSSVKSYVFISTVSVFGSFPKGGITESDAIKYTVSGEAGDYGTLKADCEKVVNEEFKDSGLIIRPGLIVGPHDPSDRFTYWPARIAKGGKMLAPGNPHKQIQFIDVRDLASWIIRLVERRTTGIFYATGLQSALTMESFLNQAISTIGTECKLVWIDDQTLLDAKVTPWMELPLWIPESDADHRGFMHLDCRKAFNAGLTMRPLAETIADTLKWDNSRAPDERKAGLSPEREEELLSRLSAHLK